MILCKCIILATSFYKKHIKSSKSCSIYNKLDNLILWHNNCILTLNAIFGLLINEAY